MIDKTMDQMKHPFVLWIWDALKLLIRQRLGSISNVRVCTPRKPVKRAYEQNSYAVKKWWEADYPFIVFRAKGKKAEVHWSDETGIQMGANRTRAFAPKGEKTSVRLVAKKA